MYWLQEIRVFYTKIIKKKTYTRDIIPNLVGEYHDLKKMSEAWRMYVDFTNLNVVCLKDSYPLPSIDRHIDKSSGCELPSFMDTY